MKKLMGKRSKPFEYIVKGSTKIFRRLASNGKGEGIGVGRQVFK